MLSSRGGARAVRSIASWVGAGVRSSGGGDRTTRAQTQTDRALVARSHQLLEVRSKVQFCENLSKVPKYQVHEHSSEP